MINPNKLIVNFSLNVDNLNPNFHGWEIPEICEWSVGGHNKKDLQKLEMIFQVQKIKALIT